MMAIRYNVKFSLPKMNSLLREGLIKGQEIYKHGHGKEDGYSLLLDAVNMINGNPV